MSESVTIIEESVEQAMYDAIKINVDALTEKNSALADVLINGLFLKNPDTSGNPGKRRDVNGPRINITCSPNIPKGYLSAARTCHLEIESVTQPDSDPDHRLAVLAYTAFRKVLDNKEFTLPAAIMELRGYVIENGTAGITEMGYVINVGVRLEIFKKPVQE